MAWLLRKIPAKPAKRGKIKTLKPIKKLSPIKKLKPIKPLRPIKPLAPAGYEYYWKD